MIRLSQVSKRYPGGHEALAQLDLHVPQGTLAFLTGRSGAGKSTLLRLLALIERPTAGKILINGVDLAGVTRRNIPSYRRQIGVVFQNHQLLFDRSVFENVALPLRIAGGSPNEVGKRARAALDKVGLLAKEKQMPVSLSAGEQQRVGIARAVVNRPRLLLADEPTGNLDPALSLEVMRLFDWFRNAGTTLLIATHDVNLIRGFSHPIFTLDHGRLVNARPARSGGVRG